MGIDGEIIKQAQRSSANEVNKFFSKTLPTITGPYVYLEDSLTRVLWNPGERDW